MKPLFRAVLCAVALSTVATTSHAKPKKMAGMFSDADRKYLVDNAQGSIYDFSLAQLAAGRASSPALHRYGLELIADHARLNARLLTLGRAKGVELPVLLSDEDKAKIEGLQSKTGKDLDKALIQQFVEINAKDVEDARKEVSTSRDPATNRTVTQFMLTEQKHLAQARKLQHG